MAGDDHVIRVYRTDGREVRLLRGHRDWVRTLAYSPDGELLASAGDRRVLLWDASGDTPSRELNPQSPAVTSVAFSPDGRQLAAVGFSDRLTLFDTTTGQITGEIPCPCADMRVVAYSPDGKLLAAGGRNGVVEVWDRDSGTTAETYLAHRGRIRGLVFSNDSRALVTCSEDRLVRVHSTLRGDSDFLLPQLDAKILSAAFVGPFHLATGGSDDVIRLWDLRTRREVEHVDEHRGSVAALAGRGGTLVSGSFDTTLRVWRIDDELRAHGGVESGDTARFTPR